MADNLETVDFGRWCSGLDAPNLAAQQHGLLRSYSETWQRLRSVSEGLTVRCVGRSVEGRPIWSFEVPARTAPSPVFVLAGLHAMEHVGIAVAVELLCRAVSSCSWPGGLCVLPVANPDGFVAVEDYLAKGKRGFLRRNARGVDLNRNFPVGFPRHALGRWLGAAGSAPFSEPETSAIEKLVSELKPAVTVSLHSFGNLLYLPYAHRRAAPDDIEEHRRLAELMIGAQETPLKIRQLGRHIPGITVPGTELDYFHGQGALSFLFEIGAGPRLRAPASCLRVYQWYSPPPLFADRDIANSINAVEVLAEPRVHRGKV